MTPNYPIPLGNASKEAHFFFGFHDLVAWNSNNNRILALRSKDITTPPDGLSKVDVGFFENQTFVKVTDTTAYNYPQGSRQQWVGDTNLFVVNEEDGGKWCSKIYDTDTLSLVKKLLFPTHVLMKNGWAFGLDYARLHRVGGYGYTGQLDDTSNERAPLSNGIIKHSINSGENELLISIKKVANYQMTEKLGNNHYITHLLLSPDQTRLAFLHRYKLKDGGETTRLMTIGVDGKDLNCLTSGFLSHFDWKSNEEIVIWGRVNSGVEKFRNSPLYNLIPNSLLITGKKYLKKILKKKPLQNDKNPTSHSWLLVKDINNSVLEHFAVDVMKVDGHPMFCPSNRDWLVCDTYPNDEGIRQLYLYNWKINKRIELGTFKMVDSEINLAKSIDALKDVSSTVLKAFSIDKMAFYRSGFHCDLHPRWQADGKHVCFDSIHEGFRNMYIINVANILQSNIF